MTLLGGLLGGAGNPEPDLNGVTPPSQKVVDFIHGQASTSRQEDLHHRIGFGETDAAAGNHTHNGKNSQHLFTSVDLDTTSGASTTAQLSAAINKINTILKSLSD